MLPKISFNIWALVARYTGTCCPALVLWMPAWWAVDAHATGIVGPTSGHIFLLLNDNYMATVNYSWRSEGNSENIKMGSVGQM